MSPESLKEAVLGAVLWGIKKAIALMLKAVLAAVCSLYAVRWFWILPALAAVSGISVLLWWLFFR